MLCYKRGSINGEMLSFTLWSAYRINIWIDERGCGGEKKVSPTHVPRENKYQKIPGDGETHSNVEVYTLGRQRSPHRANPGREWQRGGQTDTVNGGRSRQASQGAEMRGRGWWVVGVGDVQVDVTLLR